MAQGDVPAPAAAACVREDERKTDVACGIRVTVSPTVASRARLVHPGG